jgi:hypothetical protein
MAAANKLVLRYPKRILHETEPHHIGGNEDAVFDWLSYGQRRWVLATTASVNSPSMAKISLRTVVDAGAERRRAR